ncbi:YigZ family protein [Methylonatrum kenyense]|uniref:IMPACT family protein n=1 Tax=Methylonatrum kenyense TaxID=455253 RepID=UPI0020C0E526|nr:YigZ family protein [Methylonatrum kenyense]MCK8517082.1 YigZ family protein [Methylonatrum kenyense]
MTDSGYPIPEEDRERETEVRKSRFIARVHAVRDRQQAMERVALAQQDHPNASHHCWAYVLGRPGAATSAAMNDDGEPSGTAGKPILNVIEHKAIGDVLVVVIRYFGGVKLGAGGLVRAYAGATESVLGDLPLRRETPQIHYRLVLDFADEQPLRHWLDQHGGALIDICYAEQVTAEIAVPGTLQQALVDFAGSQGIDHTEAQPRR